MDKNIIKDYSRKISERMWNLPDKGELESHREETYIDDIIQKSHIEKKLLENLEGIDIVFDAGAGSGRFSILLAKHGCRVTHFDISQPMIWLFLLMHRFHIPIRIRNMLSVSLCALQKSGL